MNSVLKNKKDIESEMKDLLSFKSKTEAGTKMIEEKFLELEIQLSEVMKRIEELEVFIESEKEKFTATKTVMEISKTFSKKMA